MLDKEKIERAAITEGVKYVRKGYISGTVCCGKVWVILLQ
jgi:hypothetical protein